MKYLFTATFADGTTVEQTPEDRSTIDPEKRSAFYDVMQLSEQKQLVSFVLKGEGHSYSVDLKDGHFAIDGVVFLMHESNEKGFELIYFRQHTHHFNHSQAATNEIKHDIVFRLGWKAIGNQSLQRVMQID